jgi:outer membrane receptor for ferric coprogen and ferric-rhodotorulic acid
MSITLALIAATAAAPAEPTNVTNRTDDEIIITGQRTEGQDDYAVKKQTTTYRFPLSQRETPQSVSVITRAQIDDFKLNDINDVLKTAPGVQVQAQETDRIYYSARGFDIQTFQIDGIGLPFAFQVQTGSIDTAIYDHIDVVRGAPGLLSSTGNPSAVVNFIRKRPTKELQASANAQYGSFDHVRLDGDVSVPITKGGAVRARAVGVYDDGDSYLDRYRLRRWTGYGIVEADLGPQTTLTVGYAHQDHKSNGAMWGALPIYYTDGTRIDLPRSANTGPSWAGWHVTDRQIFGDLVHHFNDDWHAKLSVNRRAISETDKLFYALGTPDRETGEGVYAFPGAYKGETRNLTVDAYVAGKVALLGRQHDVMFGVNRSAQRYEQGSSAGAGGLISFDEIYDGSFAYPNFSSTYTNSFTLGLDTTTKRETVYGLVRLNLADPLKLMVGGNYTHATSDGYSYGVVMNYDRNRFLPFIGATFDLTGNVSAYASYSTIFKPQTETSTTREIIEPITGDNVEAGFKGEWYGGRLNASIAVFQARQKHTAESAGALLIDGALVTVYRGVDAKSQGIELEFGGQLLPGVQATGSYTLMRIRGEEDEAVRTFVPRNLAKFNLSYSPPSFDQIKVGVSAQYQSRIYLDPLGIVSSTTGEQVRLEQKGYALIDLFAKYDLTEKISVSANLKNLTNVKYIQALNFNQGYYGAPRTILGTISMRY